MRELIDKTIFHYRILEQTGHGNACAAGKEGNL